MVNKINLTSIIDQTFSMTISWEDKNRSFTIHQSWNEEAEYWTIDLYDGNYRPLIMGIPLLCGHDLLEQYQYMQIGSLYIVNTGDPSIEQPSLMDIGNFELLWVTE